MHLLATPLVATTGVLFLAIAPLQAVATTTQSSFVAPVSLEACETCCELANLKDIPTCKSVGCRKTIDDQCEDIDDDDFDLEQDARTACEAGRDFHLAGYTPVLENIELAQCTEEGLLLDAKLPEISEKLVSTDDCKECCLELNEFDDDDFDKEPCQESCHENEDYCMEDNDHADRLACLIAMEFYFQQFVTLGDETYWCSDGKITPVSAPTIGPTSYPTAEETDIPSASPVNPPTLSPTPSPTAYHTGSPTESPSTSPVASPTESPSKVLTESPTTESPTFSPIGSPTNSPSKAPVISETNFPTASPIESPTLQPTDKPTTSDPTSAPTVGTNPPTLEPTSAPTETPSKSPTVPTNPPVAETGSPTLEPTSEPTEEATDSPTIATNPPVVETGSPTLEPTSEPTEEATDSPTVATNPPVAETVGPTRSPTGTPETSAPTKGPTESPTDPPLQIETLAPTSEPTEDPDITNSPTRSPTSSATRSPTSSPIVIGTSNPAVSPVPVVTAAPVSGPVGSTASPVGTPASAPSTLAPSVPTTGGGNSSGSGGTSEPEGIDVALVVATSALGASLCWLCVFVAFGRLQKRSKESLEEEALARLMMHQKRMHNPSSASSSYEYMDEAYGPPLGGGPEKKRSFMRSFSVPSEAVAKLGGVIRTGAGKATQALKQSRPGDSHQPQGPQHPQPPVWNSTLGRASPVAQKPPKRFSFHGRNYLDDNLEAHPPGQVPNEMEPPTFTRNLSHESSFFRNLEDGAQRTESEDNLEEFTVTPRKPRQIPWDQI